MKIGITGGIGSGKTIVTKIFLLLNIPVYNADDRAKWLMANHPEVRKGLIFLFGEESFNENGLNRTYIANKVFNDQEKLRKLNALVHPEVGRDFENWASQFSQEDYVIKEAALMFESGSYRLLDKVITVFAPKEIREQRILKRDSHRTLEDIRAIMSRQWTEEDKMEKSDYIIFNDEKQMLIPQVLKLDQEFKRLN